jgi:hypothetical protein
MVARAKEGLTDMTTETTTVARADIMQLTDDEIDNVGGGFWGLVVFGVIAVASIAWVATHPNQPFTITFR